MELSKINKVLEHLDYPENSDTLTFLEKQVLEEPLDGFEDGRQGYGNSYAYIYTIKGEKGIFLRVEKITDSYGDNEATKSVSFVKPVKKEVTQYEVI